MVVKRWSSGGQMALHTYHTYPMPPPASRFPSHPKSLVLEYRAMKCHWQAGTLNLAGNTVLLGLFGPILIATYYRESACTVQAPDVPHLRSFLDSAVPSGFSPATIPLLLFWLFSP